MDMGVLTLSVCVNTSDKERPAYLGFDVSGILLSRHVFLHAFCILTLDSGLIYGIGMNRMWTKIVGGAFAAQSSATPGAGGF